MRESVVVIGPAPPLRGGIAAHTARLVEAALTDGLEARAISYRRLYPSLLFPGRSQRTAGQSPDWSREVLDVLDPRTWWRVRADLAAAAPATVIVQWWHPVVAPALLAALRDVPPPRLVAVCHNVLPHEAAPGARWAARAVLGRCGRVLCHGGGEANAARRLLGAGAAARVLEVPLPMLMEPRGFGEAAAADSIHIPPELASVPARARLLVCAGHLRAYKGVDVLLAAWAQARRPPQARLLLAGESYLGGRARRNLLRAVSRDSSILLLDRYLEDAEFVSVLARAEALVLPYRRASQSGVLPLAEALGVPCLVTSAGALPEQAGAEPGPTAAGTSGGPRHGAPRPVVVEAGAAAPLASAIEAVFAANPVPRPAIHTDDLVARAHAQWRRVIEATCTPVRPSATEARPGGNVQ